MPYISDNGYLKVNIGKHKYAVHRLVMDKYLKGQLKPYPIELVHHINGNKLDNRIGNLKVVTPKEHSALHPHPIKTHCKRGHEFNEENTTYNKKTKSRNCKECDRINHIQYRAEVKDGSKTIKWTYKTKCPKGHMLTKENVWTEPSTKRRRCKICLNLSYKERCKVIKPKSPGESNGTIEK